MLLRPELVHAESLGVRRKPRPHRAGRRRQDDGAGQFPAILRKVRLAPDRHDLRLARDLARGARRERERVADHRLIGRLDQVKRGIHVGPADSVFAPRLDRGVDQAETFHRRPGPLLGLPESRRSGEAGPKNVRHVLGEGHDLGALKSLFPDPRDCRPVHRFLGLNHRGRRTRHHRRHAEHLHHAAPSNMVPESVPNVGLRAATRNRHRNHPPPRGLGPALVGTGAPRA